jgi:archaeosine-15-forming tRNA-guanine transglycosylase
MEIAQRRVEDPARQVEDEVRPLGEGKEPAWVQQPVGRVVPTHEGLDRLDAAVPQPCLRLVVQHQVARTYGVA